MAYDPTIFNVDPYFDDTDESKKHLRILYKPGFAVQARELTQMQTLGQLQVQRFGDHIFKDGSIVSESQVFLNKAKYVRIDGLTGYAGVSITDFDGLTATVSGKNTISVINTLSGLSGSNVDGSSILIFSEYLAGATAFGLGDTITANLNGTVIAATITGGTATVDSYSGAPSSLPAFGSASLVGIDDGVRYVKGFFVKHDQQKLTPYNVTGSGANTYRVFNNLNRTIKLSVTDTIVTESDDTSLRDPASGSYNYAAPGADRYRIDLTLEQGPLSATAQYTLLNIENDVATYKVNYPEYNVLADTLARRTYDESGNYTVDDFPITIADSSNEDQLDVVVGNGKAYIFGYEFVNYGNKTITVDKARSTKTISSQDVPTVLGNEANVTLNAAASATAFANVDWNGSPLFYLSSGSSGVFSRVGTARIGRYDAIGSTPKVNLYDFKLDAGYTSGSVRRAFIPGFTGSDQHVFSFTNNPLTVSKTNYNSLLFPLSNDVASYAVYGINSQEYVIQKSIKKNMSGSLTADTITTADFGSDFTTGTWHQFNSPNDLKILSVTGANVPYTAAFGVNNRTISLTAAAGGTATIFAKIRIDETGTLAYRRTKTSTGATGTLFLRSNGLEQYAYFNGHVDVCDVLGATAWIGGVTTDVKSYFTFDSGQKDDVYDWSRLVLKNQYADLGITSVNVTYNRYVRGSGSAPFIMDSYGTTSAIGISGYKQIPVYSFQGRNGKVVSLAGCYDFRPDRITPSSFTAGTEPLNYSATGNSQLNDVNLTVGWSFYLPRTDKLVLTKDKEFKVITGIESEQAPAPEDSVDAMTLGTIFFSPFTKTAKDTNLFATKNRRFTMRDIGKIEKRVERLEYYTTLSLQEKDAKNLEIQDANGLNKFKNGIYVDDFTSRANSAYNFYDHQCAVDPERKEIRPRFKTKYVDFGLTGSIPSGLTMSADGLITCDYSTVEIITQPLASKGVNVNPFNVVNFNGRLSLTPSSDDWVDTQTRPEVLVNLAGENSGIADGESVDFGTIWNNWETQWTGRTVGITPWNLVDRSPRHAALAPDGIWRMQETRSRTALQETSQFRTGERISLSPETITRSIGDRVVDVSIVPFMRAATVTIKADGMRPGVRVYPFFDGEDISSYVTVNGVAAAAIVTDSEGRVGYSTPVVFNLPAGIFRTGERMLRLIDDVNNSTANCSTSAEEVFRAQGLVKVEENTVVSTRNINIRREDVREDRIFNNTITENSVRWIDPVAQTIFIDPVVYPSGVFVKKVSLYFKTKSSTLPVSVQIRPTVNGYPSSSTIIPFSEVYKSPSDVSVSDDASSATDFDFSSPVYLQPGEYAITVISNSNDYEVWVAEVGQNDVQNDDRITSQPYAGSFFKSQNSSTWTAEQNIDLKFDLHKCEFESGGDVSFSFVETDFDSTFPNVSNGANIFKINSTYITPANTSISCDVQFEAGGVLGTAIPMINNQNYVFPVKQAIADAASDTIKANFTVSSSDGDVTPVLDTERISGLYVQNGVYRFGDDSYKDLYEKLATVAGITDDSRLSQTRYLSKIVNLQEGFESDSVDVYLTARLPLNSDLRVYMRSQSPTDNTRFEQLPFEPLSIHPSYAIPFGSATGSSRYVSVGEDDYVDLRFTRGGTSVNYTSGLTGETIFKSFEVKVVMYGDANNSIVPSFKDFKVIAT